MNFECTFLIANFADFFNEMVFVTQKLGILFQEELYRFVWVNLVRTHFRRIE